jgi:hypothetical protein
MKGAAKGVPQAKEVTSKVPLLVTVAVKFVVLPTARGPKLKEFEIVILPNPASPKRVVANDVEEPPLL